MINVESHVSFLRKQESRDFLSWIPACARMTIRGIKCTALIWKKSSIFWAGGLHGGTCLGGVLLEIFGKHRGEFFGFCIIGSFISPCVSSVQKIFLNTWDFVGNEHLKNFVRSCCYVLQFSCKCCIQERTR